MKKIKIVIGLIIFAVLVVLLGKKGQISEIEDKEISAGIGVSTIKTGKDEYVYSLSDNVYFFIEDKDITSDVYTGVGETVGKTREDRATKLPKEFFLGQVKVFIIDSDTARRSIRTTIDGLFNNPLINDNSYCIICKGSSNEILKYKIEGVASPAEYIEGMIKHMENFNFFKEEFKVRDVFLRLDSEGRSVALPCIDIDKDGLQIIGVGMFKKDNLLYLLDMEETKSLNILRNQGAMGMLSIQKDEKDYINYYAKSKKKVKCTKVGDKYNFLIELALNGDITSNNLYKDIDKKTDVIEEFQKDMGKKVEDMCNRFLYNMKNNYKVDCLELGRIAAAKYGRDTGVDWNEVVCNSEIKVKVKVKVDKVGRGQY